MNIQINSQTHRILQLMFYFIVAVTVLFSSISYAKGSVYVSSLKAKVFQQPDFKSPVLMELSQSSKLKLLGTQDFWIHVEYENKTGWMSKYLVTEVEPITHKISIFNRIRNFFRSSTGRDRVSVVSTAGGIRGLSDGEIESSGAQDFESLHSLEKIEIPPQELDTFIQSNEK